MRDRPEQRARASTAVAVPRDDDELEERLSLPDDATCQALASLSGDILILGAGGKMGPTLARMARRALDARGIPSRGAGARRVIAVSRFGASAVPDRLTAQGVEIMRADLTDPAAVRALPSAENVVWMVGQKFGSSSDPVTTWAHNVVASVYAAEQCANARVVCFSTGNVYPRTRIADGGARETLALVPDGEYSASCIGRERVFQAAQARQHMQLLLYRLFYACDLRYGVVTDLALRIARGEPVSLATGAANVIWQGDANRLALRALTLAGTPAVPLNVTGPIVRIRALAEALASRMRTTVTFADTENPEALIANVDALNAALPYDALPLDTLVDWAAHWVERGGTLLGKPTRFEVRDGRF